MNPTPDPLPELPLTAEHLNILQPAVDKATSQFAKPLLDQAMAAIAYKKRCEDLAESQDSTLKLLAESENELMELRKAGEETAKAMEDLKRHCFYHSGGDNFCACDEIDRALAQWRKIAGGEK